MQEITHNLGNKSYRTKNEWKEQGRMKWNIIQKKENRPGTDRGLDIKIYIPTSKLFSFVQTMKNEWSTNYLMLKSVVIRPDDQSSDLKYIYIYIFFFFKFLNARK